MTDASAPERRFDFIAFGRAAVDLYGEQIGGRLEDMTSFAKYLGGCPANISVGAARLGLKPAMLTRVGDEHMGRFVRETLAAEGVDVSHVRTDPKRLTALAILGIRDRDTFPLLFYRENCADMAVEPEDFDRAFIASAKALVVTGTHFSTAAIDRTGRTAIRYARESGTRVVLDIDYRPVLWGLTGRGEGENRFVAADSVSQHLQSIVPDCDLIVGTEEEVHIAGGSTDTLTALRRLRALSTATIVLKRGAEGCVVYTGAIPDRIGDGIVGPGFPVEVFNVLGAGDAFMAGLLRGWLRGEGWERAAAYANACGALVVSRHGCAPAMASWTELTEFMARTDRPKAMHLDARGAYLHRVTTRTVPWPEVTALAFDHRVQFEELADRTGRPRDAISRFKNLVAAAAREGGTGRAGAAVIIDDHYGMDALFAFGGSGWWIARPVELPRATPLAFEQGDDLSSTLRTWPVEQVAKCLVQYHPAMPAQLLRAQEPRLRHFQACANAAGRETLVEIVPPNGLGMSGAEVAVAVEALYAAGMVPDWWKLMPAADAAAWSTLDAIIDRCDPHCRGVILLGLDSDEQALADAFGAAAASRRVKGFAVGRHIFWEAAERWFAGALTDDDAVATIVRRYRRVLALWDARGGA